GTLSGHPVVMAAGEATLCALTPDVYERIEAQASPPDAGAPVAGSATARAGSLLTVFFRPTPPRNFAEARESDTQAFARFFHGMLDAGVLLPPSQFEAWFVSAAHDEAAIDHTLRVVR